MLKVVSEEVGGGVVDAGWGCRRSEARFIPNGLRKDESSVWLSTISTDKLGFAAFSSAVATW